jgi:hypothetical protein
MYQIAEAFCQLSILAFYLRIATSPKLRTTTYILMGIVTCFGIGSTGAMMFQCQPISFFWNGEVRQVDDAPSMSGSLGSFEAPSKSCST